MRITIAERLRPFSHLPGTAFVVPGSSLSVQIFPALIRVKDLASVLPEEVSEISLDLSGPVEGFTVVQDLEKGSLRVFGNTPDGYLRYSVRAIEKGIVLSVEKAPANGVRFQCRGRWISDKKSSVHTGENIVFGGTILESAIPGKVAASERLSLGSHKLQDWELVRRRLSFTEIFPLWFRLGQMVPEPASNELAGTALLLNDCRQAIAANAPEKILKEFRNLFLAGFDGVLSPRLIDTDFNGIKYRKELLSQSKASAMMILTDGARLIRSLFIREEENAIHMLPALPPEFHCGRLLDVRCGNQGKLSLEWTKKSLRCMTFSAAENQKMAFSFSNHEKKCRLRHSHKDNGIAYIPGDQLDIVAGQNYWFDNFQR